MNTREDMIQDYDAVLDSRYGKEGTAERIRFEENAYAYYTGLILRDARKEAKITQTELARRTQTTKSYISRIENGLIIPSVAVFYRIIAELGMSVQIIKPKLYDGQEPAEVSQCLCEDRHASYRKK